MSLASGVRIGPYEILGPLGAGGMGEVYRARDAKLNRDVALKVLPELFALDIDRLARFQREAKTLAALNHPNIAAIYGFEQSSSVQALVLELVEGPTLAEKLEGLRAQGSGLPFDEALPIARQIAEALEAAHEQGIIHRDLKPANVKLRPDGTVKVLDFGLAKALEPAAARAGDATMSPTITSPAMTQMGVILGTAAYMSPEQAKGRQADKRSDVWAFGAVLYEMLTGQRAFKGDDIADTLAAVLRQEVDLTALPASTPAPLRRLIARCLDRDVKRRLRDIGEARIVLEDPAAMAVDRAPIAAARAPRSLWRRAIPVVVAAVVAGVLAAMAERYFSAAPSTPLTVTRFPFVLPEGQNFALPPTRHIAALANDGAQMVYAANSRLYFRSMSALDVHAIPGTEGFDGVTEPVFSPDGRSVAFYAVADRTLKRIATTGGAAVTLCTADNPHGVSWGPRGILFGQGSRGIMQVSPNGGNPEAIVRVKDDEEAHGPQLLPDGQHVLFTVATGASLDRWDSAHVVVQSLTSGERTTLIDGGSDARYVSTGHLIYGRGRSIFASAFDLHALAPTGERVPMVVGVLASAGASTGAYQFSVSDTGSLIFIPGPAARPESEPRQFALIDRKGKVEPLALSPGQYLFPRVSPDGTRIVFGTDDGKEAIVWIYELSGTKAIQRLTFGGNNRFPIWSSDSRRVAYQSDREGDLGMFWQSAAGGAAERLTKAEPGESHEPESWSPKSDRLLFSVTKKADISLWTVSLEDRKPTPFGDVHSSFPMGARFSPDGRWVAYASAKQGATTVYVQPFPATEVKYQLSAKGLDSPHEVTWSPDGKELFYVPRIFGFEAVSVTTQPTFAFGNAVAVPRPFRVGAPNSRTVYDITPDGRFLAFTAPTPAEFGASVGPARHIQVVLNWAEELRTRLAPTK
jgi:Tol biopolymer transport system component